MGHTHKALVTVSRQMASGGSYIAYSVARKLGIKYLDNEVLYRAAKFMGMDVRELSDREERIDNFITKIARSFCFGSAEAPYVYPSGLPIYDMDIFDAEARIIKEVASTCHVVIVGRAGHYLLRGYPGLVTVFVHAPLGFRIKRLMEIRKIAENIATAEIRESDKRREKFLRYHTGLEWTNARNYHLCIDTAATSFEEAIEMIVNLVRIKNAASVLNQELVNLVNNVEI